MFYFLQNWVKAAKPQLDLKNFYFLEVKSCILHNTVLTLLWMHSYSALFLKNKGNALPNDTCTFLPYIQHMFWTLIIKLKLTYYIHGKQLWRPCIPNIFTFTISLNYFPVSDWDTLFFFPTEVTAYVKHHWKFLSFFMLSFSASPHQFGYSNTYKALHMLMNKPSFPTCNEITQSLGADLLATVISCLITSLLSIREMNRDGLNLRAWSPKYLG